MYAIERVLGSPDFSRYTEPIFMQIRHAAATAGAAQVLAQFDGGAVCTEALSEIGAVDDTLVPASAAKWRRVLSWIP
jgi:hypothetical protein